jgi:hypothetical protein
MEEDVPNIYHSVELELHGGCIELKESNDQSSYVNIVLESSKGRKFIIEGSPLSPAGLKLRPFESRESFVYVDHPSCSHTDINSDEKLDYRSYLFVEVGEERIFGHLVLSIDIYDFGPATEEQFHEKLRRLSRSEILNGDEKVRVSSISYPPEE